MQFQLIFLLTYNSSKPWSVRFFACKIRFLSLLLYATLNLTGFILWNNSEGLKTAWYSLLVRTLARSPSQSFPHSQRSARSKVPMGTMCYGHRTTVVPSSLLRQGLSPSFISASPTLKLYMKCKCKEIHIFFRLLNDLICPEIKRNIFPYFGAPSQPFLVKPNSNTTNRY